MHALAARPLTSPTREDGVIFPQDGGARGGIGCLSVYLRRERGGSCGRGLCPCVNFFSRRARRFDGYAAARERYKARWHLAVYVREQCSCRPFRLTVPVVVVGGVADPPLPPLPNLVPERLRNLAGFFFSEHSQNGFEPSLSTCCRTSSRNFNLKILGFFLLYSASILKMARAVAYHPLSNLVDKFTGIFPPFLLSSASVLEMVEDVAYHLWSSLFPGIFPIFYFLGCHQLAFSKVKANLGLDQATSCFTGAAPISVEVSVSKLVNFNWRGE